MLRLVKYSKSHKVDREPSDSVWSAGGGEKEAPVSRNHGETDDSSVSGETF